MTWRPYYLISLTVFAFFASHDSGIAQYADCPGRGCPAGWNDVQPLQAYPPADDPKLGAGRGLCIDTAEECAGASAEPTDSVKPQQAEQGKAPVETRKARVAKPAKSEEAPQGKF